MSEPVAIRVEQLGKRFRIGSRAAPDRFTERLQESCLACVRRPWQWLRGSSSPAATTASRRDESLTSVPKEAVFPCRMS